MTFEDTLRRIFGEVLEEKLRERDERASKLMTKPETGDFLTVDQAAAKAGVEPGTIRQWVKEKKLRAHRAGNRIRIKGNELERAMSPRLVVLVDADIDQQAASIVRKLGA